MTRTRFLFVLFIGIVAAWAVTAATGGLRSLTNLGLLVGATLAVVAAAYVLGTGTGSGRRAARLAALGFATGVAALLLEAPAMLGLLDYRTLLVPKMPGGPGPHNRVLEPGLLYRRPPHDEFTSELFGDAVVIAGAASDRRYVVDYRADAHGMRNATDFERADVALVGDSFVEGYRVKQSENTASRLAEATGLDVVNLGQSGWGPGHELAAFEKYGVPLEPDVVLWFFFEGNDLRNLDEHRVAMADFERWKAGNDGFLQRSLFANAKRVLIGLASAHARDGDSDRARALSGRFDGADGAAHRLYFTIRPFALDARARELLDGTFDILASAKARTEAVGGRFVLVFVPSKFRVYGGHCDFAEGSWCVSWKMNRLPQRMAAWARESGAGWVDLTETLEAGAAAGELLYLPDDPHWNPAGERAVAKRLEPLVGG